MPKPEDIYCVAAEWLVQPGQAETVRRLLREAAAAVRQRCGSMSRVTWSTRRISQLRSRSASLFTSSTRTKTRR